MRALVAARDEADGPGRDAPLSRRLYQAGGVAGGVLGAPSAPGPFRGLTAARL